MAVYQILVCYFTAHEHLYMDYKNDISFLIDSTLNLYELKGLLITETLARKMIEFE